MCRADQSPVVESRYQRNAGTSISESKVWKRRPAAPSVVSDGGRGLASATPPSSTTSSGRLSRDSVVVNGLILAERRGLAGIIRGDGEKHQSEGDRPAGASNLGPTERRRWSGQAISSAAQVASRGRRRGA